MSAEGVRRKVLKITRVGSGQVVPVWQIRFECFHAILLRAHKQPERTEGTCPSCGPAKSEVVAVAAPPTPTPPGVA